MAGFEPGPVNPQPLNFGHVATLPAIDPLDFAPPRAGERLRLIRQRAEDLAALIVHFAEIKELSDEKNLAEARLRQLVGHPQDFGMSLPEDNTSVKQAKAKLAKLTDELRRLNERADQRSQDWNGAGTIRRVAENWLREGVPASATLEDFETEIPKLAKGEVSLLDQIENRRRRVREIKAIIHRHESAPYPSSYVKRKMREEVQQLAMRGEPIVSNMVEHDGALAWPTQRLKSTVMANERQLAFAEIDATIPLIAWLFQKELVAALDKTIDEESDDNAALSGEDRQIKIAELMGDLADVEYSESELVFAAQAQGLPCEHRPDINPACLLGVKFVTRAAGIGHDAPTSIGQAYTIARR